MRTREGVCPCGRAKSCVFNGLPRAVARAVARAVVRSLGPRHGVAEGEKTVGEPLGLRLAFGLAVVGAAGALEGVAQGGRAGDDHALALGCTGGVYGGVNVLVVFGEGAVERVLNGIN